MAEPFSLTGGLIAFDLVAELIVVLTCLYIYQKTRSMYGISLQKGLKYFSNAFGFYTFSFTLRLIENIAFVATGGSLDVLYQVIFSFLGMYGGAIGGFYLAYSLMWHKFEKDRVKRTHWGRIVFLNLWALAISAAEIHLVVRYGLGNNYIFFPTMIILLIVAALFSYKRHCHEDDEAHAAGVDPHFIIISLALGVYVGLFLENMFIDFVYTIHFYIWGIITMLFLATLYQVARFAK